MGFFSNSIYRKRHALLGTAALAVAMSFLLPHAGFSGETDSDMMFEIWRYQSGQEDTGLLTGKPSHKKHAEPPGMTVSVRGTVAYWQRIALLPSDIVEVQLLDVSAQNSTPVVIAQNKITPTNQMPISFKLAYNPAKINPAHQYSIQARVLRNGQPAFINRLPCFVITYGYANYADIIVGMTDTQPAVRAEEDSLLLPSIGDPKAYLGTYTRSITSAGGTITETLCVLSDNSIELQSRYSQGTVKRTGVWSLEKKLLSVLVTQKNGEYINPDRIVLELQSNRLIAVEYDIKVYGSDYSFTRLTSAKQAN
jgi:putative lipoprotein